MAGASGKRIASQNTSTVKQLRIGFAASAAIYILSLLLSSSNRSWSRLFYYSTTEVLGVVLWQQLESMARGGDDLAQAGLTSYTFDVIYVTWFVHTTTALVSAKFWWLYLSIPAYATYRLGAFALPYIWPSSASATKQKVPVAAGRGGRAPVPATTEKEAEGLSKRQEKLKKRGLR